MSLRKESSKYESIPPRLEDGDGDKGVLLHLQNLSTPSSCLAAGLFSTSAKILTLGATVNVLPVPQDVFPVPQDVLPVPQVRFGGRTQLAPWVQGASAET